VGREREKGDEKGEEKGRREREKRKGEENGGRERGKRKRGHTKHTNIKKEVVIQVPFPYLRQFKAGKSLVLFHPQHLNYLQS
jgi:hypothetical protein